VPTAKKHNIPLIYMYFYLYQCSQTKSGKPKAAKVFRPYQPNELTLPHGIRGNKKPAS